MNIKDKIQEKSLIRSGPMINAYPDSIGEKLEDIIRLLKTPELENTFDSFYILPSIYNTDLDRGFSVIDYELNENYASLEDLKELKKIGMALKLDIVLNHSSVLSKQFQDILNKGENSKYKDFFIIEFSLYASKSKVYSASSLFHILFKYFFIFMDSELSLGKITFKSVSKL